MRGRRQAADAGRQHVPLGLRRLGRARPARTRERDPLLETPAAALERDVERGELLFEPACSDAQGQPAAARDVDRRRLLREHDGLRATARRGRRSRSSPALSPPRSARARSGRRCTACRWPTWRGRPRRTDTWTRSSPEARCDRSPRASRTRPPPSSAAIAPMPSRAGSGPLFGTLAPILIVIASPVLSRRVVAVAGRDTDCRTPRGAARSTQSHALSVRQACKRPASERSRPAERCLIDPARARRMVRLEHVRALSERPQMTRSPVEIVPLREAIAADRPRRRHRRAGRVHPPDSVCRRSRDHPAGAPRSDARPHDARRHLRPDDRHGLRAPSWSSRGAETPASDRCTGSATPSRTAGPGRSSSRSTATPAWPPVRGRRVGPAVRRAARLRRQRPAAHTATITSIDARSPARCWRAVRRSTPTSTSSTRSGPTATATCSCGASSACRRRPCCARARCSSRSRRSSTRSSRGRARSCSRTGSIDACPSCRAARTRRMRTATTQRDNAFYKPWDGISRERDTLQPRGWSDHVLAA